MYNYEGLDEWMYSILDENDEIKKSQIITPLKLEQESFIKLTYKLKVPLTGLFF